MDIFISNLNKWTTCYLLKLKTMGLVGIRKEENEKKPQKYGP